MKALLDSLTVLKLRSAGFSFAAIGNSLIPPVSKQYVRKLFWRTIDNLNRERRQRAEKWRVLVDTCDRMDRIDPPPRKTAAVPRPIQRKSVDTQTVDAHLCD